MRGLRGICALAAALLAVPATTRPARAITPSQLAAGLVRLSFDANALDDLPPRPALSRWAEPMRLFAFVPPSELEPVWRAARDVSQAAAFPITVVDRVAAGDALPNAFVVISPDLASEFRGRLRPMLTNALQGDGEAVDRFIELVVATDSCWVLPVWSDPSRLVLKAAVIGVDARLPPARRQACLLRKLGAALGLLGGDDGLADSVFSPESQADRLSWADGRMLRVLYGPELRIGMTRDAATEAAEAAFGVRPPYLPPPLLRRDVPPIVWDLPLPDPPPPTLP